MSGGKVECDLQQRLSVAAIAFYGDGGVGRRDTEKVLQHMGRRDHRIDNIRWLLILLVVFGHLIESVNGDPALYIYTVIYVFHMPAFVFITGYFAKFKLRRIASLALTYVVFQTLYLLFDWLLTGDFAAPVELQYLVPDWIMWYLLATLVWVVAIPLFKTENRVRMAITLAVSVAIALAAGFFNEVGYFLSLSRILVFAPFFIAGFYARALWGGGRSDQPDAQDDGSGQKQVASGHRPFARRAMLIVGLAGAAITFAVVAVGDINSVALYNSLAYGRTGTTAEFRLGMMVLAACWICLLFAVVPDKRIPAVSNAGSHSLPIYLIHGFVIRAMRVYVVMPFGEIGNILVSVVLAFAIVFAFGHRILDKIVRLGL